MSVSPVKLRRKKLSITAQGILAKQTLKRYYLNIKEDSFRSYVASAVRGAKKVEKGEQRYVEDTLVGVLEVRLDALLSRLGLLNSPHFARQLISHGKVIVNGGKVDVPSFHVKAGDLISFSDMQLKKLFLIRFLKLLLKCRKKRELRKPPFSKFKPYKGKGKDFKDFKKKPHWAKKKEQKGGYKKGFGNKWNNKGKWNNKDKYKKGKWNNKGKFNKYKILGGESKKPHALILPLYVSNRLVYLAYSVKLGALMLLQPPRKFTDVYYPFNLDMHALLMHYKYIRG